MRQLHQPAWLQGRVSAAELGSQSRGTPRDELRGERNVVERYVDGTATRDLFGAASAHRAKPFLRDTSGSLFNFNF